MFNLSSFMIGSTRPEIMGKFYEQVIGKPADIVDPEKGVSVWQIGNGFLSILYHSEMNGNAKDPGRMMFILETLQVKEEFERIKALDAQVVQAPYELDEIWIATFADPDGNYFQLMSPLGDWISK
jgi:predicted enzyme related to lactoylglutathione lyase